MSYIKQKTDLNSAAPFPLARGAYPRHAAAPAPAAGTLETPAVANPRFNRVIFDQQEAAGETTKGGEDDSVTGLIEQLSLLALRSPPRAR